MYFNKRSYIISSEEHRKRMYGETLVGKFSFGLDTKLESKLAETKMII